jgi:hypothetical protein
MRNRAKILSERNGKLFLQEAFHKEQRVLEAQLAFAESSISHYGKRGDVTEKHFLETLRAYLPNRYSIDSAIIIDSKGRTSDQIDIVIYDRQYTPTLLDQADHKYIPAEAVYAVMEVKPVINKEYLIYAGEKAESVRRLFRTSIPVPTLTGIADPKLLFPILSGLVAAKLAWKDGLGKSFIRNFAELKNDQRLDCVLAVNRASFDMFDGAEKPPRCCTGKNVLVFFLFRLLEKLQSFANVPAISWNAYASQLNKKNPLKGGSRV